jgi:hypothetical protein
VCWIGSGRGSFYSGTARPGYCGEVIGDDASTGALVDWRSRSRVGDVMAVTQGLTAVKTRVCGARHRPRGLASVADGVGHGVVHRVPAARWACPWRCWCHECPTGAERKGRGNGGDQAKSWPCASVTLTMRALACVGVSGRARPGACGAPLARATCLARLGE